MGIRQNEGYAITDSFHLGKEEFVLGVHLKAANQYVTWRCRNQTDYYWGHYFNDLFSAQKDLVARAQEEIQYLELKNEAPEPQKPVKKRERER